MYSAPPVNTTNPPTIYDPMTQALQAQLNSYKVVAYKPILQPSGGIAVPEISYDRGWVQTPPIVPNQVVYAPGLYESPDIVQSQHAYSNLIANAANPQPVYNTYNVSNLSAPGINEGM